jgi:hypothetical protein
MTLPLILALLCLPAAPPAPPPAEEEIRAFFAELSLQPARPSAEFILARWDFLRAWQECRRVLRLADLDSSADRLAIASILTAVRAGARTPGPVSPPLPREVLHVEVRAEGNEAMVVTRERRDGAIVSRTRWWLVRKASGFRVYDSEDLDVGLRASLALCEHLAGTPDEPEWLPGAAHVFRAALAVGRGEPGEAEAALEAAPEGPLPAPVECLRLVLLAGLRTGAEDVAGGIAFLEAARAAAPEPPPVADYLLAVLLTAAGKPDEALEPARRFLALFGGNDPDGRLAESEALLALDRGGEAAASARAGLAAAPGSPDLLAVLARALPAGERDGLVDHFAAAGAPGEALGSVLDVLLHLDDLGAFALVLAKFRELHPEDPEADWWEAALLSREEKHEAAAATLLRGRSRAPEEEREAWADAYAGAMILAGKPLEGYAGVAGSAAAFERVAVYLRDLFEADRLLALVEAHRLHAPGDLAVVFFEGEARALRGEWAAAEALFAAGMARAADDETREDFRTSRILNLYEAGEWRAAWRDVPPRRDTFRDLAAYMADDVEVEALSELLKAERAGDPGDPALPLFAAELAWLFSRSAEVVDLLSANRELIATVAGSEWRAADRLIRSHLRLGQVEPALAEARNADQREGEPFYEALCLAVAGKPDELLPLLERLVAADHDPKWFYLDEFLGKALRSEPFAKLRERFPE